MRKSHPPPPYLVNGHFFTGGLWYLNGLLSNEFLSLYKCIPQPNDAWFGILDQSFAPAQRLIHTCGLCRQGPPKILACRQQKIKSGPVHSTRANALVYAESDRAKKRSSVTL